MQEIDDMILNHIESDFKTVKEISEDLKLPYVRVSVRLRQLRRRGEVTMVQSNKTVLRGVKPLKYRKKALI